jgi:hypothetical protein
MGRGKNRDTIYRGIKACIFAQTQRCWTDQDLADHLGIARRNAIKYRDALSLVLPIEVRREGSFGNHNRIAVLYGIRQK